MFVRASVLLKACCHLPSRVCDSLVTDRRLVSSSSSFVPSSRDAVLSLAHVGCGSVQVHGSEDLGPVLCTLCGGTGPRPQC